MPVVSASMKPFYAAWAPAWRICVAPSPLDHVALSPQAGDLLCVSWSADPGGVSRTQLWAWRRPRCLWEHTDLLGLYAFSADARYLISEGIELGGLDRASPYICILDVQTGAEVYFESYADVLSTAPEQRRGRRPDAAVPGQARAMWTFVEHPVLYHPDGAHAFAQVTPEEGPPELHVWRRREEREP